METDLFFANLSLERNGAGRTGPRPPCFVPVPRPPIGGGGRGTNRGFVETNWKQK